MGAQNSKAFKHLPLHQQEFLMHLFEIADENKNEELEREELEPYASTELLDRLFKKRTSVTKKKFLKKAAKMKTNQV